MRKGILFFCLFMSLPLTAFAKSDKPMRPARPISINEDLHELVWQCSFTVTPQNASVSTCTAGKFNTSRTFVPINTQKEHREMARKTTKLLDIIYACETYPYKDPKSKKLVERPTQCMFEITRGVSETSDGSARVRKLSGVCPILFPSEQFLFKDRLENALNAILYERGEIGDAVDNQPQKK
jgi:hypothetical protein